MLYKCYGIKGFRIQQILKTLHLEMDVTVLVVLDTITRLFLGRNGCEYRLRNSDA